MPKKLFALAVLVILFATYVQVSSNGSLGQPFNTIVLLLSVVAFITGIVAVVSQQ